MTDWNKLQVKPGQKFAEAAGSDDWDSVPEERGPARSNLPMGRFGFALPANLDSLWEISNSEKHGARAYLKFTEEPLLVVQAPQNMQEVVGSAWYGIISGTPRNRARKGDPDKLVADLIYLLRFGFNYQGKKPVSNEEIRAAMLPFAGKTFAADNEWSSYCGTGKVRYIPDPENENSSIEDPEGKMGCGKNYYARDIRALGSPERFLCGCGASLRAFQGLSRFGTFGGA